MGYRDQIREARLAAKLTFSDIQRLAGIPRGQYKAFEEGGNIGVWRLEKILSVIPNLPPLHLGNATVAANRSELAELQGTIVALRATLHAALNTADQLNATVQARIETAATAGNAAQDERARLAELQEFARQELAPAAASKKPKAGATKVAKVR
ncbi:MAG TPA: hypothetical protein VF618_26200 [Thermoanaerobaculia bacterium]